MEQVLSYLPQFKEVIGLFILFVVVWKILVPLFEKFVLKNPSKFEKFLNNDFKHIEERINRLEERQDEFNKEILNLKDDIASIRQEIGYLRGKINQK
jgi:septal ring factor EnvC (AmiA/AmiB activator)